MPTSPYPTLSSPFRLGHVEARNGIVATSHATNRASELRGCVAASGTSLLTTVSAEASRIDHGHVIRRATSEEAD